MDRKKIVKKHSPVIQSVDPRAPLSIGNGEFGFSVDITGLQTFPDAYETPLSTQSNWGWHSTGGKNRHTLDDVEMQYYQTYGREVAYPMKPGNTEDAYHWLRQNPHRLQLGRIGFRLLSRELKEVHVDEVEDIHQTLDLWTGKIKSEFTVDGTSVTVNTVCHPEKDTVAVNVSSNLIKENRLQVISSFPNPNMTDRDWMKSIHPDQSAAGHETKLVAQSTNTATWKRSMDDTSYKVAIQFSKASLRETAEHTYTITPDNQSSEFEFVSAFAQEAPGVESRAEVFRASEHYWPHFWEQGGFISFEGSSDPRANELERRVVLSSYLTKVHSSGSLPPQETGYMYNSWFGIFHLEMHWWHGVHFPLWGRALLLENSMDWYTEILPKAKKLAESQGYKGARWPKMVAADGEQTPSPIAPGLIWQQPHPIALAELIYKSTPTKETLERFKDVVFESANFMVSFAKLDQKTKKYVLGPPLIPSQENHAMEDSKNPPYELEYWKYGLEKAIQWAERLEEPYPNTWKEVAGNMAPPPQQDGVYLAHENCPDTFTKKNQDHPSMVAAFGMLPGKLIDPEVMRQTLYKVRDEWKWDTAWGWDFPMCAMTAARIGERKLAVDFLLMEQTKNTYLANGHNYQREGLSVYLPGNGGLLTAIAMMAAGWEGATNHDCPGFPNDGTWKVEYVGLHPWL